MDKISSKFISCDHVRNSHDHCVLKSLILQGEIWCWSLLGLKGHLKSEFALSFKLYCVYFTSFNPTKVGDFFWRWILKDWMDRSSGREKENRCLVFKSFTKREIRHFQVVVVQRRQRNVWTSVMHMQNCCFTYLNLLQFAVLVAVAVVRRVA